MYNNYLTSRISDSWMFSMIVVILIGTGDINKIDTNACSLNVSPVQICHFPKGLSCGKHKLSTLQYAQPFDEPRLEVGRTNQSMTLTLNSSQMSVFPFLQYTGRPSHISSVSSKMPLMWWELAPVTLSMQTEPASGARVAWNNIKDKNTTLTLTYYFKDFSLYYTFN